MSLYLRSILALVTSFSIILLLGPYFIRFLKKMSLQENTKNSDSSRLNTLHSEKSGTPTMGGLLILFGTIFSTLSFAHPTIYIGISLFAMIAFALIGFFDDFQKIRGGGGEGLTPRGKLLLQILVAFIISISLWIASSSYSGDSTLIFIPGTSLQVTLMPFWVVFSVMVIVGSTNSVNLTDGLDGLAAGASAPVFLVLMAIACISGQIHLSSFFSVYYIPQAGELMILMAALIGGILGFLWFNCFPAQIFMGDTGSLSLGAMIGVVALILNQPFLLLLLAGVFVLETLSVILQVSSYKLWKKRIFRIAPLHHHYQFQGLSEAKITVRFWILSSLLAMLTLISFVGI